MCLVKPLSSCKNYLPCHNAIFSASAIYAMSHVDAEGGIPLAQLGQYRGFWTIGN